ncbi:MAG: SurA N-terminal domain-containing protein [Deltaproteobacteria bacterium]|nr:SurA N-terminal domain-containing protein [Deltaproteobacteria bacterium]
MLGLMRKHATSWLIKVALFAIVIVFIFWGGYSYTERKASRVAAVNGSYISMLEFQSTYNNLLEQMRSRLGDQFSPELAETLNLKRQALDQLINRRLILAEAKILELDVSREELQNAIISYPAFQTNGHFDQQRYQQILRLNKLTPQDFEASQRENLLINKVQQLITRTTKVLDAEILSFFHHTQDKVNLAYIQVDPKDFKTKVKEDEESMRDYFDKHRENYRLPAKRNILYVRFRPQDYIDEVQPTDREINDYYLLHQEDYKEPEKVRARHILFRIPPKAKTSDIQAIQKRAEMVLELARKGEDFAKLARKYSEDSTASKGGDLGYFTREDMVKPFSDSAFSLEKGEISDLVRTRFGLHIIKVEDIKEESIKPLAEVKKSVIQSVKQEQAREIARQQAESFIDLSRSLDDMKKAAQDKNLETKESGFFAANEPIPSLGSYPEVSEVIFSLQEKEISPALALGDDQLVAQLIAIQDSRLKDFDEAKKEVREDWLAEKSRELARAKAQAWLEMARREGTITDVARNNNLQIRKTGLFTAISPARSLGNQKDLVITAFALRSGQPVAPEVYEVNGKYLILQLEDRQPATEEEFQKQREDIARQLLIAKKEQTFSRWIMGRRERSEIEILQKL